MTPRRKRLLIALAAVLALSAGFWWLTRPVIDPRLVGTWAAGNDAMTIQPNGEIDRFVAVVGQLGQKQFWAVAPPPQRLWLRTEGANFQVVMDELPPTTARDLIARVISFLKGDRPHLYEGRLVMIGPGVLRLDIADEGVCEYVGRFWNT